MAVPIPEPDIIWGPRIIAKISNAKKMKIGTIKYLRACVSEPAIWEDLMVVIGAVVIN